MDSITGTDNVTKLTDWVNEPSITSLKKDLEHAKNVQANQVAKMDDWKRAHEGKPPTIRKNRSNVQPKLIRTQAEWRYPSLSEPFLSSRSIFTIYPRTFEDTEAAKQNQLLLNYQMNTAINKVHFIDSLVRSTVDEGTAVVRLGWRRETKPEKEPVYEATYTPVMDEQYQAQLQQLAELKVANPREYNETVPEEYKYAVDYFAETGQVTMAQLAIVGEAEVDKVIVNQPTLDILDPRNVYIDPTCNGNVDNALFIVISREVTKSELMVQPDKYVNLDRVDWEAKYTIADSDHVSQSPESFNFNDVSRRKVIMYEYWGYYDTDGTGHLEPILVSWIGNVIVSIGKSPFSDGKLPFVVIPYLPVKRSVYGETDAELLQDNQSVQGAIVRGMIDLLGRSANAQRGTAKGMLDPLNKKRFDNGSDYEFNPNLNPIQNIIEHKYPEIPNSALTLLSLQGQTAEAITGIKSFQTGISGEGYGDVAISVKSAINAQGKREMAILRRLAKGVSEIGQRIISMNADFLSEVEVIRITNTEFVEIKRDELKGRFDLEVDISTAEVDQEKVNKLSFLLQTLGNNVDFSITQNILSEIAELSKLPDLAEKIRTYKPQPDPLAEQLKQLELKRVELEISEIESKIALNQAKAKALTSKADLDDLEFVEKEGGVTHTRDIQKQSAQAKANQNLEITKALLKPKEEAPDVTKAIGYASLTKDDQL